ncbi:MAG: CAP domain-containing protein [Solirubrobacteraceae bacterium]
MSAAALTLIAFGSVASAHSLPCGHAHAPIRAASRAELRTAVVCLINQQRRDRHLPALAANGRLDHSAQGWTNEMVSHRNFSHGASFSARISAVGFDWSNVGENIAGGFQTPAAVVNGWMASTGHCQNILSPAYREVGTGVSAGSSVAGSNAPGTWTQDFGLLMGQHPASSDYGPASGCPYR